MNKKAFRIAYSTVLGLSWGLGYISPVLADSDPEVTQILVQRQQAYGKYLDAVIAKPQSSFIERRKMSQDLLSSANRQGAELEKKRRQEQEKWLYNSVFFSDGRILSKQDPHLQEEIAKLDASPDQPSKDSASNRKTASAGDNAIDAKNGVSAIDYRARSSSSEAASSAPEVVLDGSNVPKVIEFKPSSKKAKKN